jgi:hypothetical protein
MGRELDILGLQIEEKEKGERNCVTDEVICTREWIAVLRGQ